MAVVTCMGSCACHFLKVVEKKENIDPLARVLANVPVPTTGVIEIVHSKLYEPQAYVPRGLDPEYERRSHGLLSVAPLGIGEQRMRLVRTLAAGANPWLKSYTRLPESSYEGDLYLTYRSRWTWWASESYSYEGKPAKFSSDFIVHISAVDSSHTDIEIFEVQPQIWVGHRYGVGAHGPGRLRDYRDVDQSLGDRQDLLTFVLAAIDQAQAL